MAKKRKGNKSRITPSPQHGVNPSMALCFFCGESKGLVMLGKLKDDAKAPREGIYDYQPCDKCAENWKKGTPIIRCTSAPVYDRPPIVEGAWPTGAWCVIDNAVAEEMLVDKDKVGKPLLMEASIYDKMIKADNALRRPQDKEATSDDE